MNLNQSNQFNFFSKFFKKKFNFHFNSKKQTKTNKKKIQNKKKTTQIGQFISMEQI